MSRARTLWIALSLFALTSFGPVGAEAASASTKGESAGVRATRSTTRTQYSARLSRARRLKLARARAAARARELREASTPRFKLDENGGLVPDIRAAAAIIYNPETNQILWEANSQDTRSIASITKVMTATVFLENNPDLGEEVIVNRADVRGASTTYLRRNERVNVDDLLHLLLIASDNAAARVLARISPGGYAGFLRRMNEKAIELGLEHTSYADPSGLLADNVSSAYDMARLIAHAAGDERIASSMRTPQYTFRTNRRTVVVNNTNQLVLGGEVDVRGGKTGFITRAGYCLATLLRLPQGGPQVAVVVLGARSNAGRFWETRHLFNWLSGQTQDLLGQPQPQN